MPETLVEPDGSVERAGCRKFNIVRHRQVLPWRQDAARAEPRAARFSSASGVVAVLLCGRGVAAGSQIQVQKGTDSGDF